jgi:hypothetical protein
MLPGRIAIVLVSLASLHREILRANETRSFRISKFSLYLYENAIFLRATNKSKSRQKQLLMNGYPAVYMFK